MTERQIIDEILLAATERGDRLFRNNCGRMQTADGRWIKYGVCNPGGSDLIGWTAVNGVAVFTGVEVKVGKTLTTQEQWNFVQQVNVAGGIAGIVRSVEEFEALHGASM